MSQQSSESGGTAMGIGCVVMMALGLLQVVAGYAGLSHSFGTFWAVAAIVALMFARVAFPLTIGAFFCARDIWGWHWFFAVLFAAPGLLFALPSIVTALQERARSRF